MISEIVLPELVPIHVIVSGVHHFHMSIVHLVPPPPPSLPPINLHNQSCKILWLNNMHYGLCEIGEWEINLGENYI